MDVMRSRGYSLPSRVTPHDDLNFSWFKAKPRLSQEPDGVLLVSKPHRGVDVQDAYKVRVTLPLYGIFWMGHSFQVSVSLHSCICEDWVFQDARIPRASSLDATHY